MKSTTLSLLASSLFLPLCTPAKTADESSTGALIKFPSVALDAELYNQTWDVSPSQFGYQAYGGSLEGVLVLPMNTSYHLECPDKQEPVGGNPYIHYIEDWFVGDSDVTDFFLLVDRLDCYFVEKIEHAQTLGASAVVMCDWLDEGLFTMWMPQDWKDDIHIPAVLLQREHCETLYAHMGVQNWDPQDMSKTTYPTNEEMQWTLATIEWGLPHEDDRVEYQLWTSSNDYLGSEFKHNFNDTAIALDLANDTLFTPHMYILNGSHWQCDEQRFDDNGTAYWPCGRQCTNGGRYCSVDPEYDLEIGLDGLDVIQENLRSLCVWQYDKEYDGPIDDVVWWDYAVLWDENCGVYSNTSENFNVACAYAQMDALVKDKSLSAYVKQCVTNSGGYGLDDGKNSILERETKLKYNSSIYAIPMVRVNEFLIHGNIDCVPPVTKDSCAVLAAICAGFIEGTQPDVCLVTPSPTEAVCTDDERDCAGECFGNHLTDACDACLLVSSHEWNACIGCNGQINGTFDCEGTCGGHYAVNECGFCKDTRRPGWDEYGEDCNGGCDLTLSEDRCGQCLSGSDEDRDSCVGCDNVANSGKAFNPCGFCIDSKADNFASYGFDCRGICGELYQWDECGECLATTDTNRNACLGCDGVANSDMKLNDCGICVSTTDDNFDDYGKDCRDKCPSGVSDTHYVDECGRCLLPSGEGWNNCTGAGTEVTSESVEEIKEKEQEMTTVIVIVVVVAFLIVVAAALIIGAMWRKQGAINARFDSLAATYVHMDEKGPNSKFTAMSKSPDDGVGVQHTVADDSE